MTPGPEPSTPKLARLYKNPVSFFGALVMILSILLILMTLGLEFTLKRHSPYMGIFTWLVFPSFFALGLALFLFGMWGESRRRRRLGPEADVLAYPRVDLNDPVHRRKFGGVITGLTAVILIMGFVTYNAFLYTESVSFCGTLCHTVMEPEHKAYLASPHARVRCVDCHVGHGASWYVKAKISGLRQVWAVATGHYPTPIPTPIQNLRPARETCEECHWPAKFFGTQLLQIPHFRYDERNTPEQISIGVKTGGGHAALGQAAGIHWHMIIERKVRYVATDRRKQEIPWFEIVDGKGAVVDEYLSLDYQGTKEQLATLPREEMDCMDCHNRPTHIFFPPEKAVDQAMTSGGVSRTLPWAKKVVVDALVREYPTRKAAHEGLQKEISGFYEQKYPAIAKERKPDVERAVATAISIYDRSVFPEMQVNWKTYPSNIGHRNWPGCFRCHDGRHVSKKGKVLTTECSVCHTMPERGPLMPLGTMRGGRKVPWHPVELVGEHSKILCSKCHEAGYRPPSGCAECHKIDAKAPMMTMDCTDCHAKPGQARPITSCRECHDPLHGLHRKGGHRDSDCTDCHKPHAWDIKTRAQCLECHSDMEEHHPEKGCTDCHGFRQRGKGA